MCNFSQIKQVSVNYDRCNLHCLRRNPFSIFFCENWVVSLGMENSRSEIYTSSMTALVSVGNKFSSDTALN